SRCAPAISAASSSSARRTPRSSCCTSPSSTCRTGPRDAGAQARGTPPRMTTILFLGADPADDTRLALGEEVREITHRLRDTPNGRDVTFAQEWAVRPGDLQGDLLRHRPSVVHFGGHASAAGELLLEDEQGKAVPVSLEALSSLFRLRQRDVRCVVL